MPERPFDQLWVVSCRGVRSASSGSPTDAMHYWRYGGQGRWLPAGRHDFVSGGASGLGACVFVAGYGYDSAETRSLGLQAYRGLTSGVSPSQAVRFVIWSWPSDQGDAGVVRDIRAAAARTDRIARDLALWLEDSLPGERVSLIGTSFGARIVGGALHLLGGGSLGAYDSLHSAGSSRSANVVLISPAIDDDWLLPGHRFSRALSQVDRMLLLNNSSDPVMKRYHWLYGFRSEAEALGHAGLCCRSLPYDERAKITQIDAATVIGAKHGCGPYFQSPGLLARMRPFVFEPEPTGPALRGHSMPASFPLSK